MACTTILVGKKASYDGSTMIARNDDSPSGVFHVKKMVVIEPKDQVKRYKSVISQVEIELPDNPLRYTLMTNVDLKEGVWGAAGINSKNVGMTATETITSNPLVLGADPLIDVKESIDKKLNKGIGEEDFVVLVLPYINSAKEGVLRLGKLLEEFGTYESNGIAFNDENEIWWLETIGGHHWIAKRVPDDKYVVMPNQFGLDNFDIEDALSEGKNNLCSKDLKEFIENNHLDLSLSNKFNPRICFGSHDDSDHVYNTPRAWFMLRYFNPRTYKWDGDNADFKPEDDDLPWSMVPEKKITIEDVKYILSSYFQGTIYNPYLKDGKHIYRPIGVNRTSFMAILQIRPYVKEEIKALEWVCFGSNAFNAIIPLYTNTSLIPEYLNNTTMNVSTDNFYWNSRLIGALADAHFNACSIHIERYQDKVANSSHQLINKYDNLINNEEDIIKANNEIANMAKNETQKELNNILFGVSMLMKNGFARSDN